MDVKAVYEMQETLRRLDDELGEVARQDMEAARNGAFIGTLDYLQSPLGRKVAAYREQVRLAQEMLGGVVYKIPSENLYHLTTKLDALIKRTKRLGHGEVTYRVDKTREVGGTDRAPKYSRYLVLNATPVKLAGWMFLATLTIESGGVMISKVPAFSRAWTLHHENVTIEAPHSDAKDDDAVAAAQVTLDSVTLDSYRDEATATFCDHCQKPRKRTKTYLVEHVETGEIKRVGGSCLRDFLGTDPHTIVRYATYLAEIMDEVSDSISGAPGVKRETLTIDYLTHVCALIREKGWVSRSEHGPGMPTANEAYENIRNYGKREKGRDIYVHTTDEDRDMALAAINWADEVLGAKVNQTHDASDFDHNLYVAARGELVPRKGDGVLAYLPMAHTRYLEREIEREAKAATEVPSTSVHVGQVKERITVTGKVAGVYPSHGDYGTTYITKIDGDDGNVYKWFGSYDLGLGNTITAKFAVKAHEEYKGTKETVVTRPTGVEVLDGEAEFADGDIARSVYSGRDGKVIAVNLKARTITVEQDEDEAPVTLLWSEASNLTRFPLEVS